MGNAYRVIEVIIYFISTREINLCDNCSVYKLTPYLRNTPPRRLAFKHSGGDSRLCTSATVTLYLLVLLSNDNRPGTEQNTSDGCAFPDNIAFSLLSEGFISAKFIHSSQKQQDDSKILRMTKKLTRYIKYIQYFKDIKNNNIHIKRETGNYLSTEDRQ